MNNWTNIDTVLLIIATALHIIDWLQTIQIAKNPVKYYEKNFLLGRHPSVRKVHILMFSGLIIQAIAPILIPGGFRWIWWAGWIGGKGYLVGNNFRIGLKIKF